MPEHGVPRRWAAEGLAASRRALRMRRSLRWRSVDDALVVPPTSDSDWSTGAGVVASQGNRFDYVPGTGVRRYSRELVPPPRTEILTTSRSLPRAIFGGYLFEHFGHFLLESLSRVWIEQSEVIDQSVPLVWISRSGESIEPWMAGILRQIGLEREVMIIDRSTGPLAVQELLVPQAGFELREWMHPAQLRRLGTTPWCPSRTAAKVWLSRVGGSISGGLTQEAEVETVLTDHGWSIVRPEELSIDAQVALLAGASHVAAVEGSALHCLVLVGEFGGTIDIVSRRGSPNFKVLAQAGGWNQRMLDPVGGWITMAPVLDSFSGRFVDLPNWEGIDVEATAMAIERSSRRMNTR